MATKKSDKFFGQGDPQWGVDERGSKVPLGDDLPVVLPQYQKSGPGESGLPYRGSAEKKQSRTTGVKARKRVSPNSPEGRRRQALS